MKRKNTVKLACMSILLATSSLSAFAHNDGHSDMPTTEAKFVGDTQFAGYCKAIMNDNVQTLLTQAARNVGKIAPSRRGVLKAATGESGVTCNGKSLIAFSKEQNAVDVHAYLIAQR